MLASFAGSTDYTSGAASTTFTITARPRRRVTVTDNGGTYNDAAFAAGDTVAGVGAMAAAASLEGVTPSLTYYSGTSATGRP